MTSRDDRARPTSVLQEDLLENIQRREPPDRFAFNVRREFWLSTLSTLRDVRLRQLLLLGAGSIAAAMMFERDRSLSRWQLPGAAAAVFAAYAGALATVAFLRRFAQTIVGAQPHVVGNSFPARFSQRLPEVIAAAPLAGLLCAVSALVPPTSAAPNFSAQMALIELAAAPALWTLSGPAPWPKGIVQILRLVVIAAGCSLLMFVVLASVHYVPSSEPTYFFSVAMALLCAPVIGALVAVSRWEGAETPSMHMRHLEEVVGLERDWIRRRRDAVSLPSVDRPEDAIRTVGLALSGGGIRSATTCLGFLDELARRHEPGGHSVLAHVDYLSTVSGGGWAGGLVTTLTSTGDSRVDSLPLDHGDGDGERKWSAGVRALRRGGDYLMPGGPGFSVPTIRPVVTLAWGAILNVLGALTLLWAFVVWSRNWFGGKYELLVKTWFVNAVDFITLSSLSRGEIERLSVTNTLIGRALPFLEVLWPLMAATIAFVVLGLATFTVGVVTATRRLRDRGILWAATGIILSALLGSALMLLFHKEWLTIAALCALTMLILLKVVPGARRPQIVTMIAGVVAGQGAVLALSVVRRVIDAATDVWGATLDAIVLFPVGHALATDNHGAAMQLASALGLLAIALGFFISRNHTGLHNFWTARIRSGFLAHAHSYAGDPERWPLAALRPDPYAAGGEVSGPRRRNVESGDPSPWNAGGPSRGAPLHIVNAAVNVPGSQDSVLRQRGTERFEFTPYAVGGPATGWTETHGYGRHLTLASALAISAAAVNSQGGALIPRWTRALLNLMNVGLGVFVRNPRYGGVRMEGDRAIEDLRFRRWGHLWSYYTMRELIGVNHEEDSLVFVSDGGHHDNLGLTALVERGCHVVICVDAGADPEWSCSDLARAARLLRVGHVLDEGRWELEFENPSGLDHVRPSDPAGSFAARCARTPVLVGRFRRDGRDDVHVFYVKPSVLRDLPLDARNYAEANPKFPQETTADQFFDEAQFEAYRMLGRGLARQLVRVLSRHPAWERIVATRYDGHVSKQEPPDHA